MGLINKLLQFIFGLAVIFLVYTMTVTGAFSSSQKLTEILNQSGFYDSLATGLSTQLKGQVVAPPELAKEINSGIASAVTPDLVRGIMQPSQIAIVGWLNKSGESLEVSIDSGTIKEKISSKISDPGARFEVAKFLPDTIIIVDLKKKDSSLVTGLERFRQLYQLSKTAIPILWGAALISTVLIFTLNLAKGSKKISKISNALVSAASVGIVLALLFGLVAKGIKLGVADSQSVIDVTLITKIFATLISQTLVVFIILLAAGMLATMISKLVFRSKDKKLKKK